MRSAYGFFLQSLIPGSRTIVNSNSKRCRRCILNAESSYFASTPLSPISYSSTACNEMTPIRAVRVFATPAPINSRIMSTKAPNKMRSSLSQVEKHSFDVLRHKTKAWLQIPVGTWTQREISKGRFLIREWSESSASSSSSSGSIIQERAVAQTRIVRRWMEERREIRESDRLDSLFQSQKDGNSSNSDSREMVEMLNRCLDSWRKAAAVPSSLPTTATIGTNPRSKSTPQTESMELIHLFCDASENLNDMGLRPNRKTYSMCMNVLSLHPESPTICEDVLSLLNQCRKTTKTDLQFYNVCLHTLAKCAANHPEAPALVEGIFREMTTISGLSPNTACFVSVLHAWANSIPGSAKSHSNRGISGEGGERAEAILNQMIQNYPELVSTICFNICINAWGKQGHPEKADTILRRLHQYSQDNPSPRSKTEVRPNQISFNSAINGWSKSARFGGNGVNDPLKAANRASQLLQQMKAQGLEPTPETFGSIMEAYSKTPNPGIQVQRFLNELEKMYSEGQISRPPPKVCYLITIRAWGRTKPGGAERAESLMQRLDEICFQEGGEWAELEPCTILYTALISAWAQSDVDRAPNRTVEIFQEMVQKSKSGRRSLSPNAITLNAVLEAFCNQGRIDEASEFLHNTKQVVSPDSKSYLIILKAYANSHSKNAVGKAQAFLGDIEDDYRRGEATTKPTVGMYSQILVALGNSGENDAAFRTEELFWKLMKYDHNDIGVVPDTATLNCVLRAWSKSSEGGAAERAEAFLRRVRDEHPGAISIDPISHLHLIYAWAHSRRRKAPKEAEKHLEKAKALSCSSKKSSWRLARAHFNGVILAWKKSNDINAVFRIQKLQEERDSMV